MTLGVPQPQVLDVSLAGRIGAVVLGIASGRLAEELLPPAPALELVRVLERMAGLVSHDAHAFRTRRALDVEELIVLEAPEPGMREVKRDREPGDVCR